MQRGATGAGGGSGLERGTVRRGKHTHHTFCVCRLLQMSVYVYFHAIQHLNSYIVFIKGEVLFLPKLKFH